MVLGVSMPLRASTSCNCPLLEALILLALKGAFCKTYPYFLEFVRFAKL